MPVGRGSKNEGHNGSDFAHPIQGAPEEATPTARPRLRAPGLVELEELLSERLDTRVKVDMGARRGKVVIEFASLEDLERIYRVMTAGTRAEGEASNPRSVGEA